MVAGRAPPRIALGSSNHIPASALKSARKSSLMSHLAARSSLVPPFIICGSRGHDRPLVSRWPKPKSDWHVEGVNPALGSLQGNTRTGVIIIAKRAQTGQGTTEERQTNDSNSGVYNKCYGFRG